MIWVANAPRLLRSATLVNLSLSIVRYSYCWRAFQPVFRPFTASAMAGFTKPSEDEIIEDSEPEREEQRMQKKLRRKASNKKAEIRHDGVDSLRRRVPPDRRPQDHSVIIISGEGSLVLPEQSP